MKKTISQTLVPFLVVCGAASIIVAALFGGMLWYLFSKKNTTTSLSASRALIAKEELYYHGLKRTFAETEAERKLLDSYFADPENFVPLVEEIEALGTHAGASVTIQSAALTDANRILELSLSLGGDFDEILYFLSLLETFPAKISFDRAWVRKMSAVPRGGIQSFPWEGNFIVQFASI